MGTVYEAAHTRVERRFAIKVLAVKLAGNEEAAARFQREAMITAPTSSPLG
jgi:serine/threonine protein kinase